VYGLGGVGGYFGGKIACRLAAENHAGRKVFFIARGRHLEEIRKQGLVLNTSEQEGVHCRPARATDNVEDIPPPDLCLVCVKGYDLDEAVNCLSTNISDKTAILPLLNGINVYERIRERLKSGIVLPACAYVGTSIEAPGVVTQRGAEGVILCGGDPAFPAFSASPLRNFFDEMGIQFHWLEDPYPALWEKFIFIAAFGLVSARSRKTLGEIMADNGLRALVQEIMVEIASLAKQRGVQLPADIVALSLAKGGKFPFETKTSYQRDVETEGRRNEGDLFGGTIIRMGNAAGIPTPVTQAIYSEIGKDKSENTGSDAKM
jgi:2-dehydropantoate 2-reductase